MPLKICECIVMSSNYAAELTADECWSMLLAIPAENREDWVKVAMALESHLGDDGFSIFDAWSQSGSNYNSKAVRYTWRSCRGSGVTIATLRYLAQQNGWRRDAPTRPAPSRPPQQSNPTKSPKSDTAAYGLRLWLATNKWMEGDNWLQLRSPDNQNHPIIDDLVSPGPDELVITHPYAIAKGINSAGGAARGIDNGIDSIIVPAREHGDGKVLAVQCISNKCINGKWPKKNYGPISGGYLLLGNTLDKTIPWYIAEGWSSAYSVVFHHHQKSSVCACVFGKSHIDRVTEDISTHHNPNEIIRLWEPSHEQY